MNDDIMRNHGIIGRLLQLLRDGLEPTVLRSFPDVPTADVYILLRLFAYELSSFKEELPKKVRTYSHELRDVRNEWAHQNRFSDADTLRAIDSGERLMRELGELEIAKKMADSKFQITPANRSTENRVPLDKPPRIFKISALKGPSDNAPSDRLLKDLQFTVPNDSVNYQQLKRRLDAISHQVLGASTVMKGRYPRRVIPLNFDWAREARIQPSKNDSGDQIQIVFHLGDTKDQAKHLFELNPKGIDWPASINGFELAYHPYLRIGNAFGSTLFWIRPTHNESLRTHTLDFFRKAAGKHKREDWGRFSALLSDYVSEWKSKCSESDTITRIDWDEQLTASNRNEFSLSIGMNILVSMPFKKCQTLDNDENDSGLARTILEVVSSMRATVESHFATRNRTY